MKNQIAIVDDVASDRIKLKNDVSTWFAAHDLEKEVSISSFADGNSFLAGGGMGGVFSVVFLDICMDGLDGLETASRLREAHPECLLVFVTSDKSYALDAYSVHPYDYLVKPWSSERMEKLLSGLTALLYKEVDELEVRIAQGNIRVPVSKILSVVSSGHEVEIKLENGNTITGMTGFTVFSAEILQRRCFLLINRGVIINMDHALHISKGCVVLSGGLHYPLRVKKQTELIRAFTQYQVRYRMGGKI